MDDIAIGGNMKRQSTYIRLPVDIIHTIKENPLLNNLFVVSTGYRKGHDKLGYFTKKAPSPEYFMHYCISGQGWIKVQHETRTITAGDLFLCRAHVKHCYGSDKNNPWETTWVYFSGSLAHHYVNLFDTTKAEKIIPIQSNTTMIKALEDIRHVLEKGYAETFLIQASSILALLLSSLHYAYDGLAYQKQPLDCIVDYMVAHVHKKLTLDQLSQKMHLSKDYFTKVFYHKFGYTPIDYFIRIKIQQACQILITTDYSVTETAAMLGYNDSLYFSRIFKKKMGCSPNQYRKQHNSYVL